VYDYHGLPAETYEITWLARGSPQLAERVQALLGQARIAVALDGKRGSDHGVFVSLKVVVADADTPTVALSLRPDLDPLSHQQLGAALPPLRYEGVLSSGAAPAITTCAA
jgi:aromatic ring-opening dioxygenase catalytic subunit (LigB family)